MKSGLWPRIDVVSPIDDIDDALQPGCRVTETDRIETRHCEERSDGPVSFSAFGRRVCNVSREVATASVRRVG